MHVENLYFCTWLKSAAYSSVQYADKRKTKEVKAKFKVNIVQFIELVKDLEL